MLNLPHSDQMLINPPTPDYDYIVVGAGTAGCVIASRLSEDPAIRVLVVEAGAGAALADMATPAVWPTLLGSSASWGETTVVQEFTGQTVAAPRGRALGGSSSINGLTFARGHRSSYDAWVDQGATGWGFDDLLPYFRRSETAIGATGVPRDTVVRGTDGPLAVAPTAEPSRAVIAALASAAELGYASVADISGGTEVGFGLADTNAANGTRQSAADAYLRPVLRRRNLDVVTDALATRLTIVDGVCTGVEYEHAGVGYAAVARREVVLTAGAIGSAQLLLVSGVGPADHLAEIGIDVALDLPGVGTNLHDHPMSTVLYEASVPLENDPANVWGQGVGLVQTDPGSSGPDLQLLLICQPYRAQHLDGPENGYAIGFSAILPRSRGTVRLQSADPAAAPLIDPRYLSDPHDVEVMAQGLRIAKSIGRADALAPIRGTEFQPGRPTDEPAEVIDYLRESLLVYFHYAGTCRMGTDELAVVDPQLRVHGIARLRVADASIMPSPISANTNATVYAIAERAAELIAA